MKFVCKQLDVSLSPPVCTEWEELDTTASLLPTITKQEADTLLMLVIPCLVVVFLVRRISSMLR